MPKRARKWAKLFQKNTIVKQIIVVHITAFALTITPVILFEYQHRSKEIALQSRLINIRWEANKLQELAYDIAKLDRIKHELALSRDNKDPSNSTKLLVSLSESLDRLENNLLQSEKKLLANKNKYKILDRTYESANFRVQRANRSIKTQLESLATNTDEKLTKVLSRSPMTDLFLVEDDALQSAQELELIENEYQIKLVEQTDKAAKEILVAIILPSLISLAATITILIRSIAIPIKKIENIIQGLLLTIKDKDLEREIFESIYPSIGQLKSFRTKALKMNEITRLCDGFISLIEKLEANQKVLSKMSTVDPLCNVKNRRALDIFGSKSWESACREGSPIGIAMIDIDYFKNYNDFYGHASGDQCLSKIAKELSKFSKRPLDGFYRFGGEEFMLLLYNVNEPSFKEILGRMIEHISTLKIPHERSEYKYVTISIGGIFLDSAREISFKDARKLADGQLYTAKKNGRNQFLLRANKVQRSA